MARPGVRKKRSGEAKVSCVCAGVTKRVLSSRVDGGSVSRVEGLEFASGGGVGVGEEGCCEDASDGVEAREAKSKMAFWAMRPVILKGMFRVSLHSVRAREVARVPPRCEP